MCDHLITAVAVMRQVRLEKITVSVARPYCKHSIAEKYLLYRVRFLVHTPSTSYSVAHPLVRLILLCFSL